VHLAHSLHRICLGYYKDLFKLYARLGVEIQRADFSYSFSDIVSSSITTHTIYNGASGRSGVSIPSSALHSHPETWTSSIVDHVRFVLGALVLLLNFIRLIVLSSPVLRPRGLLTFAEWSSQSRPNGYLSRCLDLHKAWDSFVERILIPTFSAVCTAPREDILQHPVEELLGAYLPNINVALIVNSMVTYRIRLAYTVHAPL
jgi:hypothetical protein